MENKTTITVHEKDRDKFKQLCLDYKMKQYKMFKELVKIAKQFKPELKEVKK